MFKSGYDLKSSIAGIDNVFVVITFLKLVFLSKEYHEYIGKGQKSRDVGERRADTVALDGLSLGH